MAETDILPCIWAITELKVLIIHDNLKDAWPFVCLFCAVENKKLNNVYNKIYHLQFPIGPFTDDCNVLQGQSPTGTVVSPTVIVLWGGGSEKQNEHHEEKLSTLSKSQNSNCMRD